MSADNQPRTASGRFAPEPPRSRSRRGPGEEPDDPAAPTEMTDEELLALGIHYRWDSERHGLVRIDNDDTRSPFVPGDWLA